MVRIVVICCSILLVAVLPLCARDEEPVVDVNRRTSEQLSAVGSVGSFVFDRSAAASFFRHAASYTELWGQMDWRREDEAFEPALGDGLLLGAFHVASYLRLDPRSVAYAGADYENGQKRNVCWNSTSDYELLRPYVLADSVGGDLQHEQYRFYGGYARVDGRFNYGLTASYRAQHEYRQVDPRPRDITADLSADLSLGYLWGHYAVGLAGGLRIYKQQQSVAFYDQNGANTSELHFTGLGTFYQRYSGTTYTSVQYRGTGWHASLTLVPRERDGWYALADYERLVVDRNLTGVNNVTLTTLKVYTLTAGLAYRRTNERMDWAVKATGTYVLRRGQENILGSGSNSDHLPLGSQTLYDDHCLNARLEGIVEWKRPSGVWTLSPSAGYYWDSEEYEYPHRKKEIARMDAGTTLAFTRLHKAWLWKAQAGGYYTAHVDGQFDIPDDTDLRIYNYLSTSYLRQSDDWATMQAMLRVQRRLAPGTAVFVSAAYVKRFYGEKLQDDNVQLSVGLCF